MSHAARMALLKACLANIPIYSYILMPVIKFPKWSIKDINSQMGKKFYMTRRGIISTTWPTSN
jgi:hypothetical protein